ncbi:MAG: GNAT family N-acetyltransferase [Chloroflexota bacterium]|nr:GNAT family N-acetyltransferase [Chloroflexota bacterium]
MSKPVYIRKLREDDLAAIVNIEDRTSGVSRPDYWREKLSQSEAIRPYWTSLAAEMDDRVVGFVLGRSGELEFGLPGTTAWIEIVGVDPAYRRQGVASKLIDHFRSSAEENGVDTIFTLVGRDNAEMERFFGSLGFSQGEMVHFQQRLAG